MKNSFRGSNRGFTLVEIVIALTISVIIMGGVLTFLTKLQDDIVLSKQSTRVYANLTDFIGTMRNFSKLYATGSVIVSGTGVYNA
jgi:prepilin-type N-terminal cleavage/methylation domain-containing protein